MVIYDITDDALRSRVALKLEDYGLERIQYSAFMGRLKRYLLNSLIEDIKAILRSKKANLGEKRNVQIFPLFEVNLKARIIIDAGYGGRGGGNEKEEKCSARIY
mgnify:CR=1 FL=1